MKQTAASSSSVSFDTAERTLLNEESYALDPSGKPQTRSAYLQLLPNIRFAFAAMTKCHEADFVVDVRIPLAMDCSAHFAPKGARVCSGQLVL
jgi:hypothetical protein